jgi:CAAX protease family protein
VDDQPGLPYHQIHRGGRPGWWRPFLGVILLATAFIVVVPLLVQLGFAIGFAVTGREVVESSERLLDLDDPTPAGLAYLNLAIAGAIPVAWLINRYLHGLRPGWLASVRPRIRWGWLIACLGLSLVALVATLAVSAMMPQTVEGTELGGGVNEYTTTMRDFLLVVAFLTPLQAAGEEYAFRGYLTQAFGGAFGRAWIAVLVPALLFALAHGGQSAPIFFDRFAFGVVAGLAVVLTGGLEAGIAMHVLNNWLAFGLAIAFGDMASTLNPTGGTWWSIPVTLTQSLVYLGLVVWAARRLGVRSATLVPAGGGVLVGSDGRV